MGAIRPSKAAAMQPKGANEASAALYIEAIDLALLLQRVVRHRASWWLESRCFLAEKQKKKTSPGLTLSSGGLA